MGTRTLGFLLAALWLFHCDFHLIPSEGIPIVFSMKSYMALAASFSLLFVKTGTQALKTLVYICREIKEMKMKGFFRTVDHCY